MNFTIILSLLASLIVLTDAKKDDRNAKPPTWPNNNPAPATWPNNKPKPSTRNKTNPKPPAWKQPNSKPPTWKKEQDEGKPGTWKTKSDKSKSGTWNAKGNKSKGDKGSSKGWGGGSNGEWGGGSNGGWGGGSNGGWGGGWNGGWGGGWSGGGYSGTGCLKADMAPSNPNGSGNFRYPNATGTVVVCFDDDKLIFPSSSTGGKLSMNVRNLKRSIIGGVNIHVGKSCDADKQGNHYFKTNSGAPNNGDPWSIEPSTIAPTGTGYITNAAGNGITHFAFDQGYGYKDTIGHVVIIHDEAAPGGDSAPVACGILRPISY